MLSTLDITGNSDRLTRSSHSGISLGVLSEFFLPPKEYRPAGLAFLLAVLLVAGLRQQGTIERLEIRYYYPCEQAYLLFLATNGTVQNGADRVGRVPIWCLTSSSAITA